MPTSSTFQCGSWQADPRRWDRCRQQAAAVMISQGWSRHSKKFNEVRDRRALRIWREAGI